MNKNTIQEFKRQRRLRRLKKSYLHSIRKRDKKEFKLPIFQPVKLNWWQRLLKFLRIKKYE